MLFRSEFEALEDRFDLASTWQHEARILDELFFGVSVGLKRKLFGPPLFAVALTTMRHQEEKAKIFWGAVARNDGLRKGTPEHTLVNWLLENRIEALTSDGFIAPALAWNASFRGKMLGALKVGATVGFRIAGTPVDLRGRK